MTTEKKSMQETIASMRECVQTLIKILEEQETNIAQEQKGTNNEPK